jgi:hypothetical protein
MATLGIPGSYRPVLRKIDIFGTKKAFMMKEYSN